VSDADRRRDVRRRIRDHLTASLQLADGIVVMINELQCTEPGCPPIETVIAVLEEGARRQFKIHKPLVDVTDTDLDAALAGEPHDHA